MHIVQLFIPEMSRDEIPSSFPPVVWKDSMIFLATSNPSQVQLWDTETRKLVQQYLFPQPGMDIYEMTVDKDRFWLHLVRREGHLIQVDVATGNVQKIAIDIRPDYLQYVGNALWVFDYPDPRKGLPARRLNREGVVEQSLRILQDDIGLVLHKNIIFVDGNYLVPIHTNSERKNDSAFVYIANLTQGGSLTPVQIEELYPTGFPPVDIYDSIFEEPEPWESTLALYPQGYADVLFVESEVVWRWFYTVESFIPLKLSGPIITHHRQGNRSNFYLEKTGEHLFIGGRLLNYPADDPTYDGLEIGVYAAGGGGEELKALRLSNSNQLICARNDEETWFGKNIWTWDYEQNKWGPDDPVEAYILNKITARLYRVSADGTTVEIPPYRYF
jgi:hypothetical protein